MKCNGLGCTNASRLSCPKCLERQDLSNGNFCSQQCFASNWPIHKLIHDKAVVGEYTPWPTFRYTGKLRPFPYGPKRKVPADIGKPDYAVTGIPKSEMDVKKHNKIPVQTPEIIAKMRVVCAMAREVLDAALELAKKPSTTTDEIDRLVHDMCIEMRAYPSPLNYHNFPKSCCTSVNEVICHGIPDTRPLQDGDIVNVDVTLFYDGVHGDLNETVCVGDSVDEQGKKLIECARKSLDSAIAMVKPGVLYRALGDCIQSVADSYRFSVVKTYCGHGINSLFHGPPTIPHFASNRAVGTMKAGHIFTIEPMINEGVWRDEHWPDKWTAVTADGKRSAQFEETLVVTESGCEVLTARK